ncbi:MAG: DNA repair protein RecO [Dehalococcoidales bacterium]|nr:DNA repair protein RecO [Dehalococcoidales bacterium]
MIYESLPVTQFRSGYTLNVNNMSEPRNYKTEAIIIKKTKLGEADRILTLYTPRLGKIQAVAKSIRQPKSKMSGHLELLTFSMVSLARGKNLATVTGSQTINSFLPIKNDLKLTAYALYVIELVNQFTGEHIEDHALFKLLLDVLEKLCSEKNRDMILRYFEVKLLDNVGYRPQLRQCVSCRAQLKPTINSFCPGAGGMLCPDCKHINHFCYPISVNAVKILRLLQGCNYNTISRLKINTELDLEIERLLRIYIKFLLEKEIKSVSWLDTIKKQAEKIQ